MLFSSIPFLYYFLPLVIFVYYITPSRFKNFTLLIASLFFYAWGEPKYVFLMVVSICVGYIFGLLIERDRETKVAKIWFGISAICSIGTLIYFKYADFFISNFNAATGMSVSLLKIALPIGISFYTFQLLSYTIDVYRGDSPAQRNPITLAAYISLFPQLIAGPIVRYSDVKEQLNNRKHRFDKTAYGIRRFVLGLSKKVLIANALGELCDIFRTSGEQSVMFYWMYAIAFTLHIYFDFSGYSDMAIGLGHIFGFQFMENFRYPYISKSITEFWRRWHISLGTWFRDYVYIPMGGNRSSKLRWLLNIFVVWFLTGFWHGASWNFIVWGLYFAVLLVIEKLWLSKTLNKLKGLSGIYVMFLVVIGFVIFNAENMGQAISDICGMFGGKSIPLFSSESLYYFKSYLTVLIIAIIGATPLPSKAAETMRKHKIGEKICDIAEPVVLVGLFILITAYLVDGSFNPFLYFRF